MRWAKFYLITSSFIPDVACQKLLKSANVSQSYKIKMARIFETRRKFVVGLHKFTVRTFCTTCVRCRPILSVLL